jgi:hypothetical protein
MKVLAINGSHRPGNNTAGMLRLVLEEVENEWRANRALGTCEPQDHLCRVCNKCLPQPECSIKDDDMTAITEKMMMADSYRFPGLLHKRHKPYEDFLRWSRWMHMCKNILDGKIGAAVTHAGYCLNLPGEECGEPYRL